MTQAYWISALANHLWQSTVVIAAAWLLAFALRNNQARMRYWIWMVASLKFLIPFSLLTEIGRHIGATTAPLAHPAFANATVSGAVEQVTQPFIQQEQITAATTHDMHLLPLVLAGVWACGTLIFALNWLRGWVHLRAAVKIASRQSITSGVPVLSSPLLMEPGVFGIFRPVLMLPEGIAHHLDAAQMQAVLAHEMSHVRRRDNLTFALHMMVETLFWFHPLMWWIRARLIDERELACDEAVLQSGSRAEVYAEGILNVCKFYVEPPPACVAGVTGSDLKQRIVRILTGGAAHRLSLGRKLLLGTAGILAVSLPIGFGLLHATQLFAQTKVQDETTADTPRYDVSTVKPGKSCTGRISFLFSHDGLSLNCIPVQMMLRQAFDVGDDRILGTPGWVKSDSFDVEAKVSEADEPKMNGLTGEQLRQMLRSLLEERFHLKYHHETRELPVYTLTIAKSGFKLKEAAPEGGDHNSGIRSHGPGHFEGINAKIEFLTHVLSQQPEISHTIIDKTGLTGSYNFDLQWTPADRNAAGPDSASTPDASGPSLFTAVQEQLGLKLEPQKGLVDVIVIDSVEKPTEN